jgi:hypothetical protein
VYDMNEMFSYLSPLFVKLFFHVRSSLVLVNIQFLYKGLNSHKIVHSQTEKSSSAPKMECGISEKNVQRNLHEDGFWAGIGIGM